MQRDDSPALDACPLFFFFEQMLFHPDSFGADAILNQADLIPLPVTFVQPLDGGAGKGRTLETKINPLAGDAIFDLAFPAMFGLAGVLSATTEAGLLFFEMHVADGAGDSAWSEHVRWDFDICFHQALFALSSASYCFRYFGSCSFAIKRLYPRQERIVLFCLIQRHHGLNHVPSQQVVVFFISAIHESLFEMLQHLFTVGLVRRRYFPDVLDALPRSDELVIFGVDEQTVKRASQVDFQHRSLPGCTTS